METNDSSENLKKTQPTNTNNLEYSFSDIPLRYRKAELKDFPENIIKQLEKIIIPRESFFITGVCGSGKTHLAAAILKEYIWRYREQYKEWLPVYFESLSKIVIEIKGSFKRENGESVDEIIDNVSRRSVLVLDDIGAFKGTDSAIEALHAIIDWRYNEVKTSIYTSNLTLAEISIQYGDRIASRLASFNQIKLEGGDRRLKK